jgi:hypothetical protein
MNGLGGNLDALYSVAGVKDFCPVAVNRADHGGINTSSSVLPARLRRPVEPLRPYAKNRLAEALLHGFSDALQLSFQPPPSAVFVRNTLQTDDWRRRCDDCHVDQQKRDERAHANNTGAGMRLCPFLVVLPIAQLLRGHPRACAVQAQAR